MHLEFIDIRASHFKFSQDFLPILFSKAAKQDGKSVYNALYYCYTARGKKKYGML